MAQMGQPTAETMIRGVRRGDGTSMSNLSCDFEEKVVLDVARRTIGVVPSTFWKSGHCRSLRGVGDAVDEASVGADEEENSLRSDGSDERRG